MLPYNAYGPWLKRRFGTRVYKVSVDGGFTCPNRDGAVAWGGCTYCSNESFRPHGTGPSRSCEDQVREGIGYLERRFKASKFLVYWQSFTNTYAPVGELRGKFQSTLDCDPRIIGMTIGTRPDCLEDEKLRLLAGFAKRCYVCVEMGLESIYDDTLREVNRGHDFACFEDALRRLKEYGFPVCAHVVLGFPGETRVMLLRYPEVLNRLEVDFVKLHHLHLVRGTRLAKQYAQKPFHLFAYREWIEILLQFLELLEPGIIVQRLFGWASGKELILPQWKKSKSQILVDINSEMRKQDSWQGKALGYPRTTCWTQSVRKQAKSEGQCTASSQTGKTLRSNFAPGP